MTLSNYQISYRGVILGDGTNYNLVQLTGIHDMVVKDSDRSNPRSQGMMPGYHSASGRAIKCSVEVMGTAGSESHEGDIQALLSAMSPDAHALPDETDDQFTFKFPGEDEKFIFARPVRRGRPRENQTEFGLAPVVFELKVYDPRTYSTSEIDSGSKTGTFEVINDGDAYAYPILRLDPSSAGAIKVTNDTNGDVVEFDNAGAADLLYFDMGRFIRGRGDLLIAYRGSTNYYGNWVTPRDEFRLSPGRNSLTLNFGDSVSVFSRDTWM